MPTEQAKYILCKILVSDSLLEKDFFRKTVLILTIVFCPALLCSVFTKRTSPVLYQIAGAVVLSNPRILLVDQ